MKNKIIVISSYPERGKTHGNKTVGSASYTKNLLINLKKIYFEVWAEVHTQEEKYEEEGVIVNRIWKRNSIKSMINLTSYVAKSQAKTVIISMEFYMFGGLLENIFFIYSLLVWRLTGKKVILILHQVVQSLIFFYWPLVFLSKKIVVFEEKFKKALNNRKVIFIPHAVESITFRLTKPDKQFKALYFGFLSPYKGIRELINLWKKSFGKLIIAGGGNPNHITNSGYSNFVGRIKATGFVPEKMIGNYFSKTDLVILPYKIFFSSSGPLSLAFSYEKPFILSSALKGYFESPDFADALRLARLNKNNFIFDFNKKSFKYRLNWAKNNLDKLSNFSRIMKEKRDWKKVAKQYEKLLK
ncbi:MAG: hypothetical protein UR89_C0035G0004 [Candidatus Roizmanbacteria bacterium GW2011_GWA2_35_8]|uniref:Glycosyl transferase family 1 domain-containing protein n=1 Tax=Candidatus Roizmanbacteria bacterium GW2011_GWA2_35_8 TaxID=1618479 RepID=A0A0G0FF26_9BACT|nr:MAG: hypothetical protein UR89_C0035G0004 [Candidatus Roizmanbacteria bacterium GW2011_GWA2_35_8]